MAAQGTLGHKLDAATEWSSGTSTAAQRVQFWHSALDMAADRPLLGWGPDTFGYMSPTYQTQKFVDAFGPDQVINGAHNTFAQTLATKGILGLAALFFFLVWLWLRAWGGWRHVRARERANPEWREQRLVLTAAIGAAVGVLLQNSFNVEIIGINVVLWAMAGGGECRGARRRCARRPQPGGNPPSGAGRRRPCRSSRPVAPIDGRLVAAASRCRWGSRRSWCSRCRGSHRHGGALDRSYQLAVEGSAVLAQPDSSSAEQTRALNSTLKAFHDAAKQNTIESRYPLTEATFQLGVLAAANALNTDNVAGARSDEGLAPKCDRSRTPRSGLARELRPIARSTSRAVSSER